uniref:Uncharacterized protein n=1 Tax=Opuntia streptacantha TaxID=393608 RepID=A0A7C9EM36_OPUST
MAPSATSKALFLTLSAQSCNSVTTANSFPLGELSSTASTSAGIPPSCTMATLPISIPARLLSTTMAFSAMACSATSATRGPTAPALTALSLFSLAEHSLYSVVRASFFPRAPPLIRSATSGGMAPQAPMVNLVSSSMARLIRAAAAFCFEVSVPVFSTYIKDLIAPEASAISILLSGWRDRLRTAVTACSWVQGSMHLRRGTRAGMAPDSAIRTRLSARFLARRRSLAAADLLIATEGELRLSMQSLTVG